MSKLETGLVEVKTKNVLLIEDSIATIRVLEFLFKRNANLIIRRSISKILPEINEKFLRTLDLVFIDNDFHYDEVDSVNGYSGKDAAEAIDKVCKETGLVLKVIGISGTEKNQSYLKEHVWIGKDYEKIAEFSKGL